MGKVIVITVLFWLITFKLSYLINAGEKYIWTNLSISDYESLKGDSPVYEDYTELKKHFGFI